MLSLLECKAALQQEDWLVIDQCILQASPHQTSSKFDCPINLQTNHIITLILHLLIITDGTNHKNSVIGSTLTV